MNNITCSGAGGRFIHTDYVSLERRCKFPQPPQPASLEGKSAITLIGPFNIMILDEHNVFIDDPNRAQNEEELNQRTANSLSEMFHFIFPILGENVWTDWCLQTSGGGILPMFGETPPMVVRFEHMMIVWILRQPSLYSSRLSNGNDCLRPKTLPCLPAIMFRRHNQPYSK